MNTHPEGHFGIVLAAGASSRMGHPKALLPLPGGHPLARAQLDFLTANGCNDALIVLGHAMDCIAEKLEASRLAFNSAWEKGRFSSVLAGLTCADEAQGYVILPVDTAGIRGDTLRRLLDEADDHNHLAIRPVVDGRPGKILWISHRMREQMLGVPLDDPHLRLDTWMAPHETRLEVDDPAILNNFNTPEQWEAYTHGLRPGPHPDGNG